MKQMKDLFYQNYSEIDPSIPNHWVVQYYVEGSGFPECEYCADKAEALRFIEKEFGKEVAELYA
ncbi:hypothetical protein [Endozoicomonas acroporae]|uniref:hypothetical protein n=1 Tax=Endozoicomonas acroporae TaxID=1701104 RepID=UPI003D7B58F7